MNMRQLAGWLFILAFLGTTGCHISRNQQLERENNDLRYSLKEKQELLERSEAQVTQLKKTVTACQEKIVALEKKADTTELKSIDIQKELDACRSKLTRQENDLEKQTEYVKNFQNQISELKKQIETISGKPTTTSAPAR
jgi:peptidoglycan hydrolase CwlO-like protein